ncbi:MAG TPA: DUF4381 domain-containing protein [Sedimenticola sp.]|nr:DUF4381 domain-containing protein [Sedimenticola sp.]
MTPQAQPLPLRDIHLPEPVSWWPPAPGWWGLLALILLLAGLLFLGRRLYRRGRLRRAARKALARLQAQYREHKDNRRLAADLSILLRRIALSQFPREDVAGLTGADWLGFLDQGLAKTHRQGGFSNGPGRVLAQAPYRPGTAVDAGALLELCAAWIEALPPRAAGVKR